MKTAPQHPQLGVGVARRTPTGKQATRSLRGGENRVQEIDSILKQLRAIAKQFNCAVLGLAQLKKEVDSLSAKRLTKADFRESGGFEQEAAVMLGLYREDYYDKQTTQKGIFEVSVLKSRFSSETTVNKIV